MPNLRAARELTGQSEESSVQVHAAVPGGDAVRRKEAMQPLWHTRPEVPNMDYDSASLIAFVPVLVRSVQQASRMRDRCAAYCIRAVAGVKGLSNFFGGDAAKVLLRHHRGLNHSPLELAKQNVRVPMLTRSAHLMPPRAHLAGLAEALRAV